MPVVGFACDICTTSSIAGSMRLSTLTRFGKMWDKSIKKVENVHGQIIQAVARIRPSVHECSPGSRSCREMDRLL